MAITITAPAGPGSWIPSGNEVVYTITTTTAWRSDLYFLIDVMVNSNTVLTLRKYPLQGQQSVKIDLKDIVDVYLENVPNLGVYTTFFETISYNTVANLVIVATEWYSGEDWATQTSAPIYLWKASEPFLQHKEAVSANRFSWEFTASGSLSKNTYQGRPMGYHKVMGIGNPLFDYRNSGTYLMADAYNFMYTMNRNSLRDVHIFSNYSNSANHIIFYGCDENGKVIKKGRTYTWQAPSTDINRMLIKYGVNGICSGLSDYIPNDTTDFTDCKYIVCVLSSTYNMSLDAVETFISQPLIFKICDSNESFAVWYKSYEGGWNIIQCNNRAVENTSVDTITRENARPNTWSTDSRMISPVYVNANSTWTLNTDWVDQYENEDIKDMLQSPCLFIQHYKDGKITYIPVTLSNATFITKDVNSKNLFNYKFEFEESFYKNTVRP